MQFLVCSLQERRLGAATDFGYLAGCRASWRRVSSPGDANPDDIGGNDDPGGTSRPAFLSVSILRKVMSGHAG